MQFAQGRVAQLDLAPILAAFASRSVISTPPRFARNCSAHARLVIAVETLRLRTSDAEHDEAVCRKPSLYAIRESRIASRPRDKMIDSTASRILALWAARPSHRVPAFPFLRTSSFRHLARPLRWFGTGRPCFEQDVERGDFRFVSRHLPSYSTATFAALPATSLIAFVPFQISDCPAGLIWTEANSKHEAAVKFAMARTSSPARGPRALPRIPRDPGDNPTDDSEQR